MTETAARRHRQGIDAVPVSYTLPMWVRAYIRSTVDREPARTTYSELATDLIVAGIRATDPDAVPVESN